MKDNSSKAAKGFNKKADERGNHGNMSPELLKKSSRASGSE